VSYCTLQQLIDRFGEPMLVELTDRAEEPTGEVDSDVVDRAIADTGALIDGFLAPRYALPISETPPLLTDLGLAIALYKLHRQVASDKVRRDYEDALRVLRDLSTGTVRLDVAGAEPPASGTSGVRTNDRDRDMTPDNLRGFV
jgi:phage gp36-like protein